jgi:large subunit ribosomal protein L6
MSRIGKKIIEIPHDVLVTLNNEKITIKGKFGTLERCLNPLIAVTIENNQILIKRFNETKQSREFHGLLRALIQNMVQGVNQKFFKNLIAEGVGYKFQLEKNKLIINAGFSHPMEFLIPNDLEIKLESNTKISISGIDKEKVGFFASEVRSVRPPEPYKGKGLLYEGEKIIRKAGKSGK